jgi:ribonuclease PH
VRRLRVGGKINKDPMRLAVAAISAGIVDGEARLDLPYVEDSAAHVDCNFVMTDNDRFVEIQGTAEKDSFSAEEYAQLVALASKGMKTLFAAQRDALTRARP